MKKTFERTDLPERLQYTKYYEHDGMLRAYANRTMVLAMLFAVIAVASLGFAIYIRLQPPTVVPSGCGGLRNRCSSYTGRSEGAAAR